MSKCTGTQHTVCLLRTYGPIIQLRKLKAYKRVFWRNMEVLESHGDAIFLYSRVVRNDVKRQFRKLGVISELRANGTWRGGLVEECLINQRFQNKNILWKKPVTAVSMEVSLTEVWGEFLITYLRCGLRDKCWTQPYVGGLGSGKWPDGTWFALLILIPIEEWINSSNFDD